VSPEDARQIALIFKLRSAYADKVLARRFNCSIKTLYRAVQRIELEMTRNGTPPTEAKPK